MAMRSHPVAGSWFSSAGREAWATAAESYAKMPARVDPSARSATTAHILDPLVQAIHNDPSTNGAEGDDYRDVAGALSIFDINGAPHVGLPGEHPLIGRAQDMEYGTEEQAPSPHLREMLIDHRGHAVSAFEQGLLG